ncbi:hypothetical protein AKJ16_DCAP16352 [Drosera capensis]
MDESEKMTALKKAYADIILTTAKEAAARVMVSERRAQELCREMKEGKEEAMRMLIRMRRIMDSKINEAEIRSQIQQKRIEELEAQLQEAEDIVGNLRADLSETQYELERMVKNQQAPIGEEPYLHDVASCQQVAEPQDNCYMDSGFTTYHFQAEEPQIVETLETDVSTLNTSINESNHLDIDSRDHFHVRDPDFASIMVRNKEPDLYRNGCTQRIRASGRNLLSEHFGLSEEKNEKPSEEDKKTCLTPVSNNDIRTEIDCDEISKTSRSTVITLNDADKGSVVLDEDKESVSGIAKETLSCQPELVKNAVLEDSNGKASAVSSVVDQGADDIPLKYIFHRKRKKNSVILDNDNGEPEDSTLKTRAGIKRIATCKEGKSNSIIRSRRDSRQMTQVARKHHHKKVHGQMRPHTAYFFVGEEIKALDHACLLIFLLRLPEDILITRAKLWLLEAELSVLNSALIMPFGSDAMKLPYNVHLDGTDGDCCRWNAF